MRYQSGRELKRLRLAAGLSQREISMKLGYGTPQFLSNIERGLAEVPPRHFRRLAKILKVNPMVFVEAHVRDVRAKLSMFV